MKQKHTKGPWHLDGGTNEKGDLFVWKVGEYYGGHAIATVHGEIQEGAEANAHLIAAAPDLLACVREACAYAHGAKFGRKERKGLHGRCLAAVAKAQGGG